MCEAAGQIKSGQVTYAVRDTSVNGKDIKQGDIMGLSDKTIEVVGSNIKDTAVALAASRFITISSLWSNDEAYSLRGARRRPSVSYKKAGRWREKSG